MVAPEHVTISNFYSKPQMYRCVLMTLESRYYS